MFISSDVHVRFYISMIDNGHTKLHSLMPYLIIRS